MTQRKPRHKKTSTTDQLIARMKELDKIGESKQEAMKELKESEAYQFGDSPSGIYGVQTFKNYQVIGNDFIKWAQEEKGIPRRANLERALKDLTDEYLQSRVDKGLSVHTIKRDKAALNKLSKEFRSDFKTEKTSIDKITRSRNDNNSNNAHFNEEKNADLVAFAIGTGARRGDLSRLRKSDFYEDKGRLYVNITKSKGGRDRTVPILEKHRETIQNRLNKLEDNQKCFEKVHSHADIHSYRRKFAVELFENVIADKALASDLSDLYGERIEPKIQSEYYTTKDKTFSAKRDTIFAITKALGHNRLEVAVNHYLR